MHDLTHASFFSGAGGLDLGLERAGWRTVSFSEIDPYASAVLARHWPGVPNLGDITRIAGVDGAPRPQQSEGRWGGPAYRDAYLWSGGFPCQDLSVAGKRRGMGTADARTRSGLAHTFLALVERYRPPAVLLENVPGLLSSHGGKDFGALLGTLGQLGYGWAYRILDARHFGVPQRRRRVFILALDAQRHPDPDSAGQVLAVGSRCERHLAAGVEAGQEPADGVGESSHGVVADGATSSRTIPAAFDHHGYTLGAQDVDGGLLQLAPTLPASMGKHVGHGKDSFITATRDGSARAVVGAQRYDEDINTFVISPSPDPRGDRKTHGLAGRLDDGGLAATLNSGGNDGGFRTEPGEHLVATESGVSDDPLLPLGLDSHRYRCCGNGVVSSVAEWIGIRLREYLA